MDEWGELALFYIDEIDPLSVSGIELADVVDTLRTGGFTREEAGAVAKWLFECLPPQSSDSGVNRDWIGPETNGELQALSRSPRPPETIH